jgi:uncharacterized protein
MKITDSLGDRPWALPDKPWIMAQTWRELLFAHWPVSPDMLQGRIPHGLQLDTFDGQAWIGVVPFRMTNIHLHGLPPVPFTSEFLELNVRTYVTDGKRPGVWFFSLDAEHRLAVATARRWFHLPYFHAKMAERINGDRIAYESERIHRGAPAAHFSASYRPVSEVYHASPGTLEHWLTARYCLYTTDRRGRLQIGEIHHEPWPLQRAEAEIARNTMAASHGLVLPETAPILHYAHKLDVVLWGMEKV